MPKIRGQCIKCGSLLFDCPDFETLGPDGGVKKLNCRGCGTKYQVEKGSKMGRVRLLLITDGVAAERSLPVEYYG